METIEETLTNKSKVTGKPEIEESMIVLTEGQREGPLYVEKIYPDYMIGLKFPEYPIPIEKGIPITLKIGERKQWLYHISYPNKATG
ncbi:MAG: hypothetical protein QXX95_02555 [Nitrososphaerales archaeon]